jgi:transposase InsO family protein
MGVTIQFESHRVELPAIFELEHDSSVLEYYDQVPVIKLDYCSADGKRLGVLHTPDFFVIRENSAGWEECKTGEDLIRLAERNPNRYRREGSTWICPPGQQYAQPLSLYYRVRSSAEINWVFQRNIHFLEDYLRNPRQVPPLQRQQVLSHIAAQPGCSLEELFRATDSLVSRDEVYTLIAAGDVYVDLALSPLPEPAKVTLWLEKPPSSWQVPVVVPQELLRTGTILDWDGRSWTIVNAGLSAVVLRSADGTVTEISCGLFDEALQQKRIQLLTDAKADQIHQRLRLASVSDLEEATRRFRIVSCALRGESQTATSARTLRRWITAYRTGVEQDGNGYVGLLPKPNNGNPARKLPLKTCELITEFIEKDYETPKQKSMYATWAALKLACEKERVPAPSLKTLSLAIRQRPVAEQTQKRKGSRAAYQVESFIWNLEQRTPRHGDRPFEIGHIDHTQADVWVVCSQTGRLLGRPWLSFLSDAYSRRILALYITFDPPSYRSAMMIIRECVRRHGRLPQILILDGGKEFESTYFETLLARCEVIKKTRPPAKARFGSTCERLFGTTNTRLFHNLAGNTQPTRNHRLITKSVDPRNLAAWTLKDLHSMLVEYAFEVYDTVDHPALGQSPRETFESGLALTGSRPQRCIPDDRNFQIFTLPTTRKGTAKVTAGRGIKIHYFFYWSEQFRSPAWEAKCVPVRYDPFDIGTAFAFVNQQWVECHSEYYASLHGRSERELLMATEELRKRRQNHSDQFAVTAKQVATFLESIEQHEQILIQRLSDLEARSLRTQSQVSSELVDLPPTTSQTTVPCPPSIPTVESPMSIATFGEL